LGSVKAQGVVLRYANYKDYDRMLTLYTREMGKTIAISRGCRRPKSRLLAGSQLFCFAEFVFNQRGERLSVTSCDVVDSFFDLGADVEVFAHASFILNLCEEASVAGEGCTEVFSLLIRSLSELSYTDTEPLATSVNFMLKLMDITGYRPHFENCAHCGREGEFTLFSPRHGGVVCPACKTNETLPVSNASIRSAACVLDSSANEIPKLSLADARAITAFMLPFAEAKLEKRFKSAALLRQIAGR
jgi:DNA repair protein RecO (recombination protein O)